MSRNREFHIRKLSLKLMISVAISVTVGILVFFLLRNGFYNLMEAKLNDPQTYNKMVEKNVENLQSYVDENKIAATDFQALKEWEESMPGLMFYLWRDNLLLYGTGFNLAETSVTMETLMIDDNAENRKDSYNSVTSTDRIGDETGSYSSEAQIADTSDAIDYDDYGDYLGEYQFEYTIHFSDGPALASFYIYFSDYYYLLMGVISAFLAFIVAAIILLLLIHRKTSYISLLERELKILESGDLDYPVTVRGHDELSELAQGINDMRLSIIQRSQNEEEARAANHALVTAMSHDLRSPLTALIGYLDLIENGKAEGVEQKTRFINASRKKAQQIKELSDKLFEYFLVYDTENRKLDLTELSGQELLTQVLEEELFDLETRGFDVRRDGPCPACHLWVNVNLFRRLFENIFSNIGKYADLERPVSVHYTLNEKGLEIWIHNYIAQTEGTVESTEIGLKTCEKIMKDHLGRFHVEKGADDFTVTMLFPVSDRDTEMN